MIKRKVGRPPGSKNKPKAILFSKKTVLNAINGCKKIKSEVFVDNEEVKVKTNIKKEIGLGSGYKKPLFTCKKCPNKNFKFERNYTEHLMLEHSELPGSVSCPTCPAVCPNDDVLDMHIAKYHNRELFECQYCGKPFVRQAHVLRHMAQKGCDGSLVAMFPCEICNAKFTRKDNLIVHLRQMHIQKALFTCPHAPDCSFSSKNYNKLIRHWHSTHAETPNQFVCDTCNKPTMSRAAMTKHLEIHGAKKFSCDVCGYTTFTIEVIRRHVLTHVFDKPYKCDKCSASFIQRSQLQHHMARHDTARCKHCGQQFTCKARFLVHQREHEGDSSLCCMFSECPQRAPFPSEGRLIEHVKTHLDSKPYACEVCKKRFESEMNMRRHLSTHTLDRPRRCMYCVSARAYVRGQQLVRHVRKYHRDVFDAHLQHVRTVIPTNNTERVTSSEMESILSLLDTEAERILAGYSDTGVLYGGMQTHVDVSVEHDNSANVEVVVESPLMKEAELADNVGKLLTHLIDEDTLHCLGWPDEPVDVLLEKVIEQCGAKAADRSMWSRVQRLRENTKHLFVYVVDDANVTGMLSTHTIDQIVKHLLAQVTEHKVITIEDM